MNTPIEAAKETLKSEMKQSATSVTRNLDTNMTTNMEFEKSFVVTDKTNNRRSNNVQTVRVAPVKGKRISLADH